ncbi:MAG: translation initiation factor IF-3 [Bacilli bacterium]|nr:translation initiation factor IF-3 [Bacilli bacterium]
MYSLFIILHWRCVIIGNVNKKNDDLVINNQIKVPELMVIGPNGEQMGTKKIQDALTIANFAGLDLVLMNPGSDRPVAKIMDYNKFKYEKSKKQKEALKKQRENMKETKEYQLSYKIDIHDFETRRRNAQNYLEKGHKIKVTIRFRGRELAHTDLGKETMLRFAESLKDYAEIESNPKLEGKTMMMMLNPQKEI